MSRIFNSQCKAMQSYQSRVKEGKRYVEELHQVFFTSFDHKKMQYATKAYRLLNDISEIHLKEYAVILPGRTLSQWNRCSCIGPRTSGGPAPWWLGRLFIFAWYSLRSRIVERLLNVIVTKWLSRLDERLISSNAINIERYLTCSILMLWRSICVPLCPNLMDIIQLLLVPVKTTVDLQLF